MDEFNLIDTFFKNKTISRADVIEGIGDDGALLRAPQNQLLVTSMDTLIEGVHFLSNTSPFDIGYKALAVNLSDLAAMGAEPAWMMLSLTLPKIDVPWLTDFTDGMFALAKQFNMQLVGGDTTRGSLSITIQVQGFVPPNGVLRRSGAKVGDKIYVSGTLGDAGLGLKVLQNAISLSKEDTAFVLKRLHQPTPQIELGKKLRQLASSAIDISDGLLADVNHILESSNVGARIMTEQLPLSFALQNLSKVEARRLALTSGDDYELCFTVPPQNEALLFEALKQMDLACTCIGEIESEPGLRVVGFDEELKELGFRHFN